MDHHFLLYSFATLLTKCQCDEENGEGFIALVILKFFYQSGG
jgi:hypothetical protein